MPDLIKPLVPSRIDSIVKLPVRTSMNGLFEALSGTNVRMPALME